ncbi:cytochrome c oxidase subunit 3 [Jeongeupia naejangsanensis]|uniref:Cytochrome c oxidase subunit 3 n=1 Tax=Jeongeupia naejangsanensis TaxID=613195 RepID=A0ABS2BGA5_9NEIS|nr:cytochrome c oxidase subunit 3 [Jeongeupia naejangsanensis]MBM3114500.1 cytochrome c oxidase subunit 3 [Jeongeupia naejangsanensis]
MNDATLARPPSDAAARLGLWVLIAVITVLFLQVIQAYAVRSDSIDWQRLPALPLLGWNTLTLLLASIALQAAATHQRRRIALRAAGLFACAFLIGQLVAWQQMRSAGFLVAGNPANSFFYLLTGMHGVHVLGGLIAWGLLMIRARQGADITSGTRLCARYWHFLLLVWLLLYSVLFLIPPATLQVICGGG